MAATKTPRSSAKDRILAAASKLFYAEGIQHVGIDRIIAESGVAKMSLYNNFKSKDELIAACLEKMAQDWNAFFSRRLQELATEPEEQLLAAFDILQEWSEKPSYRGCPFINSSVELANPNHLGFQVAVRHKKATAELLVQLATAAGLASPDGVAQELFILIEGSLVVSMMQGNSQAIAQAKQAATVIIKAHQK
ncbi:MAG: TetR/AcrR family transcriptional regulator [Limnothrix sp. RL_2_0]|nr:TetR/AcrR family transcriptional regulator [Limnothrix sp. RL_2_0]